MRRTPSLRLLLLLVPALVTAPLAASSAPELFAQIKGQYKLRDYAGVLATLDRLETATQGAEFAAQRVAMRPAIAFYRGACLAAGGRAAEARPHFEVYLAHNPNASLDPGVHSRPVVAALEDARKALGRGGAQPAREVGSLAESYVAFRVVKEPAEAARLDDWSDGPVRHLMTRDQREAFERIDDPMARAEFVTGFWKARDPRAETADNEFRMEFEKRVAFADSRFGQDETPGSMTDRGMVFILLGPPTYVGVKPLTAGDDADDPEWWRRQRSHVIWSSSTPVQRTAQTARADASPGSSVTDSALNRREVWHYRREQLPRDVPYLQVDFDFVSKKGYGKHVLQRDSPALNTIERVKLRMRQAVS